MTDDRLEKVREEIERLLAIADHRIDNNRYTIDETGLDEDESARVHAIQKSELTYLNGEAFAYQKVLSLIDSLQEEPKKCMFTKDNHTEDKKVLCDGCEEECKYSESDDFTKTLAECIHQAQGNVVDPMVLAETWKDELIKLAKSEEPVSDDLEQAIDTYLATYFGGEKEKQDWPFLKKMAIHFANWQKQQMMKEAVETEVCHIFGDEDKAFFPMYGRIMKQGDKVKLIIIMEE